MVKPLIFKGEKRPKKRKVQHLQSDGADEHAGEKGKLDNVVEEDDAWVGAEAPSDMAGPIMLVLPSNPPSCLACDVNGSIFASPLENMVESDPSTAEPHDVRQVWVVSRIAGSDNVSLKGHHARYLSCDAIGQLTAKTEAISPDEIFTCVAIADMPGTFSIQNVRANFISVSDGGKTVEIRGDATATSSNTALRVRMQARFKPRNKANKDLKAREKVSRKELEEVVGRRLEDHEVRSLKKARVEGSYHETILDVRVKGKHDKYS